MIEAKQKAEELVSKFYSEISGMPLSHISKMVEFPK